jgi:hypothetical protein
MNKLHYGKIMSVLPCMNLAVLNGFRSQFVLVIYTNKGEFCFHLYCLHIAARCGCCCIELHHHLIKRQFIHTLT